MMIVKDTERAERSERSRAERDGGGAAGENARRVTTEPGLGSSIKWGKPQRKKGVIIMTNKQITTIINNATSKSKAMIELYNEGLEIKEIATIMNVRYNFVYNVVSNYCRMNEVELRTNKENNNSKKVMIEELFKQGKSNTEISKELKTNYNYVYKITKQLTQEM